MNNERNPKLIDCESFEDRIHEILDNRLTLTGDRLLTEHAAICPPCNGRLDEYVLVDDSVKLLGYEIDEILNEIRPVTTGTRWKRWHVRALTVAAALAAMIFILSGVFPTPATNSSNSTLSARLELDHSMPPRLAISRNPDVANTQTTPNLAHAVHRATPSTSPFSRDFEGYSISQLNVSTIIPWSKRSDWEELANPFEPVFQYSSEFPGIRPVQCSLNVTLDLLKQLFSDSEKTNEPDLGYYANLGMIAAI